MLTRSTWFRILLITNVSLLTRLLSARNGLLRLTAQCVILDSFLLLTRRLVMLLLVVGIPTVLTRTLLRVDLVPGVMLGMSLRMEIVFLLLESKVLRMDA